jgi:hypothetical protein
MPSPGGVSDIRMTMVTKNVPRREEVEVFQNAVTMTRGIKMCRV